MRQAMTIRTLISQLQQIQKEYGPDVSVCIQGEDNYIDQFFVNETYYAIDYVDYDLGPMPKKTDKALDYRVKIKVVDR